MEMNSMYHQTTQRMNEELEWINRAKSDVSHFGPLYRKYHEQIFRYVYQRINDEELAFDVTSQVFIKAIQNIHKYEFRGVPFSSWLYRIAKSELYQAFRDKKAERTIQIDSIHLVTLIEDIEEDDSEQNRKKLIKVLAQMKEKEIAMLEMRFFEQRSFKEIGEILELTENNAKVKCFRAIEKLRELFFKL